MASDPEPPEAAEAPHSQTALPEFLMVLVEEGSRMETLGKVLAPRGWTWVGAMGGNAIDVFLIVPLKLNLFFFKIYLANGSRGLKFHSNK